MRSVASIASGVLFAVATAGAQSGPNDARARAIYRELVEINTTDSVGNVTRAAEAVAARLAAAGFPAADIQVLGPDPRKGNLVARYTGTGSIDSAENFRCEAASQQTASR